ncbi:hypothetical protein PAPYR_6605 [Paratrimastix pyriformis]|uniref:N-acetyltransferase domain-containing protein n=1 Tax=Paratrimastix pyriformis TaxID=342808 RepID=A0ABQ8UG95_9EUKA|nr:hypothetical protein PAPYR_6605 [Paratrimastix pyriformis]
MTNPSVRIRSACADDIPFLVESVMNAERGHIGLGWWDLAFPRQAVITELLLTDKPACYRMDGFLIAEYPDGRRAGTILGCDLCSSSVPHTSTSRTWEAQAEAVQCAVMKHLNVEEMAHVVDVIQVLSSATPEYPGRCWLIDCVYVVPEFRGRGLADLLFRQSLARGSELGLPEARLITYSGNDASLRVYTRLGFETVTVGTNPEFVRRWQGRTTGFMSMRLAGCRPTPPKPTPAVAAV